MQLGKKLEAKAQRVLEDGRKVSPQVLLPEVAERSEWSSLGLVVGQQSAEVLHPLKFPPPFPLPGLFLNHPLKFHSDGASPQKPSWTSQ